MGTRRVNVKGSRFGDRLAKVVKLRTSCSFKRRTAVSRVGDFARSIRGYSALELILVAALTLTVGSITLPRLVQMRRNFNLQSDLRLVQVMVQTARYNAMAQGRQYQVVFQSSPSPQMQVQVDTAANPQDPLHTANFANQGAAIRLSKGVQLAKGGTLVCDFSGTVTETGFDVSIQGEPYIDLSNGSRDFHVNVSALGRVRVVQNN